MDLQEIITEILNHLRGMWRYRWQVVIVAWLVAIPGWFFVYKMPDVYEASAKVSVDTNSLLPALTQGLTASENLVDEVDLVSKAMLTRPNLAKVARETDLDLRADTPQQMEKLISELQQQVSIKGGVDRIFTIAYQDQNREKAAEVVTALLSTFVESSLGAQGDDADMTERAIKSEMDDHEQRMLQAESDLADFKKRNLGYMPDDGTDYYTRLQAALGKVTETERQMRQLKQRRDEVARQLEGEEPVFGIMPSTPAQAAAGCSKASTVAQLQAQLSDLQVDFTDKHPRSVMLRETIAALEAECEQERNAMGGAVAVVNPETNSLDANPVYQNLRLQLSNANVEMAALSEELDTRRRQVAQLRADVDKIATVETELKKLNRDYGVVATRYQELLRRWETLQSKKRLDPVTDTVQFNILEPPFAAALPVAPNRPLLLIAVLVWALGAGGAVAFGLNQLKPVFFNRHTLARVAGLPVLGSVSMIMSPDQIAARHRKTIAWTAANLALLVLGTVVIALASPISQILRNLTGSGF
ncbi:MAG: chain-length determining protein [Gammaproteobacteria bacterium]|nr:chain-length determining protein [Gammaproteobacteria bacterium]